jgi:hypothetical protein
VNYHAIPELKYPKFDMKKTPGGGEKRDREVHSHTAFHHLRAPALV